MTNIDQLTPSPAPDILAAAGTAVLRYAAFTDAGAGGSRPGWC